MRSKKIVKFILLILIIIIIGILIEKNVTAVKEEQTKNTANSTLNLDKNSDLVQKLYKSLNMDLINNSCTNENNCLNNSNYNFMYFKNTDGLKELSDDEKLFLAINSIYQDGTFSNISQSNDNNILKIKIDIEDVKDKLKQLFDLDKFESFENKLSPSSECGITEFLYTGSHFEVTLSECGEKNTFGKSKLISARKEGNFIYLDIQAFYVEIIKEKYNIYNYLEEDVLCKLSTDDLDKIDTIFDEYDITTFTFKFELIGDNYFLKEFNNKMETN